MLLELYKSDKNFLIELLDMTHLMGLIKTINQASVHQQCQDFILWEIDSPDANDLLGQLAFEANHCTNRKISRRINEIADQIENQL
jgi:hypothetical protein